MTIKPGLLTTELWVSIAVAVTGIFLAIGKITPEQQAEWVRIAEVVAGAAIAILAALGYTRSRTQVKTGGSE